MKLYLNLSAAALLLATSASFAQSNAQAPSAAPIASKLIYPADVPCVKNKTCNWLPEMGQLIIQRVLKPEALVFYCRGITTKETQQSLTIADMGDHLRFVYYVGPNEIYLLGYPFTKNREAVQAALKGTARDIAGLSVSFLSPFIASHSFNQGVQQEGWNWSSSPKKVGRYTFFRMVFDIGVGFGFFHQPEVSVHDQIHDDWIRSIGYEGGWVRL